uniref:Uncharacterized protein n=1 Tax=Anopheles maculatus TaxID=74869 RepID=A0A182SKH1_9DIPT
MALKGLLLEETMWSAEVFAANTCKHPISLGVRNQYVTNGEGIRAKFANYETKFINDFINFTRPAGDIMEPIYYDYDAGTKTADYETGMTLGGLPIPEETPGRSAVVNGAV